MKSIQQNATILNAHLRMLYAVKIFFTAAQREPNVSQPPMNAYPVSKTRFQPLFSKSQKMKKSFSTLKPSVLNMSKILPNNQIGINISILGFQSSRLLKKKTIGASTSSKILIGNSSISMMAKLSQCIQ